MKNLSLLLFLALSSTPLLQAASPWERIFAFSDLQSVSLEKLAQGEVIGARTQLSGSELSLGAEAFYSVPLPPDEVLKKMGGFSTADQEASETLDVKIHQPVSSPARQTDFAKLVLDPESKTARAFLKQSYKSINHDTGFNLSGPENNILSEAAGQKNGSEPAMSAKTTEAWRAILSSRAAVFQKSGLMGSAPYENGKGPFDLGKETLRALKSRPKILQEFAGVLDPVMAGRPIPNGKEPNFYWEMANVQGEQTISLTALFSQPADGGYRVAEVSYYVTSQYYVSLVLYSLLPAEINGRKGTVIYRSDFVVTPSITRIKGIERIAAENILLMEIKKTAHSFIQLCGKSGT